MAVAKQFQQLVKITNGTTAETDVKLSDSLAMQHIDITSGANSLNQISLAQSMCQPVAVTPNSTPSGGAYTATCSNYPDFSLTYTDKNGNTHYLVGMKVRVIFTKGIAYGSVSGGTYPTLNINSSGAIPLLAQGKTMAAGAAVDGQSLELTLIPYGNGVAWDADSNVRESTSDYTIYTDGTTNKKKYNTDSSFVPTAFLDIVITSYDSVSSYKPFEGSTQSSIEGRWWGYKHSNYGIALIMTREYLFIIRLATTNGVTSVTRQRLLININS